MAQSPFGESLDAYGWKVLFMENDIGEEQAVAYDEKFADEDFSLECYHSGIENC